VKMIVFDGYKHKVCHTVTDVSIVRIACHERKMVARNHWLGTDGPLAWPPRSPDITLQDFSLWCYIKDKVYTVKITDV
jgi:hypothetical protein